MTGCGHHSTPVVYCNAGDTGPVVGQVATITLSSTLATTGESLNYGQMGQALSASAIDCKGNAVSVKAFTYSSTSSFEENTNGGPVFADINPATGQVCGGLWNRNTGGGIANYTTCTPPSPTPTQFLAYVTAAANGATSNAVPVYVHPVVTGVVLGPQSTSCAAGSDVGTDCCPNDTVGTPVPTPAGYIYGQKCLSQNQVGQLVARVYANGDTTGTSTSAANNITCQVGHLTFGAQTTGIVGIDENGAATAEAPGSTTITATISNSSTATNAGYFSTCPPASITLFDPSSSSNSINVAVNTLQPLTATVLDTNGNVITGLSLEYNSTTPQTIPAAVGSVTPLFPGSANITAVCQPGTCNPSPSNQIGLYGNGKAITSNPITINTPGTSSTVVYMGSTSSNYVAFRDYTTNQTSTLIKLPYTPNSMVMNQAGTEIYFGSPFGLFSLATASNTVSAANQLIPGVVLSVSPDGSTLVVTDPTRQTISLVSTSTNAVTTSYNGIGTSASWSPDTQAVYITTATLSSPATATTLTATPTIEPSSTVTPSTIVLTHSTYTDWQTATANEGYSDVKVTVPSIGAFFAGSTTNFGTEARSYCPSSTVETSTTTTTGTATVFPPNVDNLYIPLVAQDTTAITDQIAATTDGKHILGAHAVAANGVPTGPATLSDIDVTLPLPPLSNTATGVNYGCPIPPAPQPSLTPTPYFGTVVNPPVTLTGINAAAITGVFPSTNSTAAFVTYTLPAGATTGGQQLPLYFPPATGLGTIQLLTLGNGATAATAPVSGVFSTDNSTFYVGTGAADGTSVDNDVHLITMTYPTSGVPTATEAPGTTITPQLPVCASTTSGACQTTSTGYAPVNLIAQYPKKTTT